MLLSAASLGRAGKFGGEVQARINTDYADGPFESETPIIQPLNPLNPLDGSLVMKRCENMHSAFYRAASLASPENLIRNKRGLTAGIIGGARKCIDPRESRRHVRCMPWLLGGVATKARIGI